MLHDRSASFRGGRLSPGKQSFVENIGVDEAEHAAAAWLLDPERERAAQEAESREAAAKVVLAAGWGDGG